MLRSLTILAGLLMLATSATAAPLPPTLRAPMGFAIDPATPRQYDFAHLELTYLVGKTPKKEDLVGKTWSFTMRIVPPNKTADVTGATLRAALKEQGWELKTQTGPVVARLVRNGMEQWLSGTVTAIEFRATIIEVGKPPHTLTLRPPAKEPETIADNADFPYLGKYPDATLQRTQLQPKAIDVSGPGQKDVLAGPPIVTKRYELPTRLSPYERMVLYRDALTLAGWTVVKATANAESLVVAHYAKDGRDLFAHLDDDAISVADVGAQHQPKKLADALTKSGHVPVYGIYFAADKDVLLPEADTALRHILALLESDPTLKLEIQGHTDASGPAGRRQPLSAARAAAVKKWLIDHKVAADRLTSKGYGTKTPIGNAKAPEGRAASRRIELKKLPASGASGRK